MTNLDLRASAYRSHQFMRALDRSYDEAVRTIWAERQLDRVSFGMLAEELNLGALSRVAGSLDHPAAHAVARSFQLPPPTLRATLQHIAHVRNCCAHHTRLWGRTLGVPTPRFRSPEALVRILADAPVRSPYRSLMLIRHVAQSISGTELAVAALDALLAANTDLLPGLGARANADVEPVIAGGRGRG